jgi:signal transduction histidine kinase
LKNAPDWPDAASLSPGRAIAVCLISATLLVGALTLLATAGEPLLPRLLSDHTRWRPDQIVYLEVPLMSLTAGAMAMTWRRRSSVLDLWLLLVLWAWLLELNMTMLATYRFSIGWYSGRLIGVLSALFVLPMFLAQTSRLYAQSVLQLRAREREQENRLLVRDAIAAAIAHELRQPLAAILMSAQAGRWTKPDRSVSSILDEIVSDTRRANDLIESTRTMFGQSATKRTSSDVNRLVRDTIDMIYRDLRDPGVTVDLQLDDSLPPIAANRIQMQQVFFNLFMNAAEAMSAVMHGPRILTIRSGRCDQGLVISVEDTGPGIAAADQDRIFDGFFTTKTHGTGLGLPICRSVITAHGGWIRAVAKRPTGTMFEIYLPFSNVGESCA